MVGKDSGLSEEEAAVRLEALTKLKINPRDQEENQLALAQGDRLYQETLGETRQKVALMVSWFEQILTSQDPLRIARSRKRFLELLRLLEAGREADLPSENDWEDEKS